MSGLPQQQENIHQKIKTPTHARHYAKPTGPHVTSAIAYNTATTFKLLRTIVSLSSDCMHTHKHTHTKRRGERESEFYVTDFCTICSEHSISIFSFFKHDFKVTNSFKVYDHRKCWTGSRRARRPFTLPTLSAHSFYLRPEFLFLKKKAWEPMYTRGRAYLGR